MAKKEDAFAKIQEHLEVLVDYGLLDQKVYDSLICYVYDYIQEIEVDTTRLTIQDVRDIWRATDKGNEEDFPRND
jgi:hypothetical protein